MTQGQSSQNLMARLWSLLTSIRLALVLLLVLAVAALMGTVVPQGENYSHYLKQFGSPWAWLLWELGLTTVYQSPWFMSLIGLLLVNLLACSCRRFPETLRRANQPLTLARYQALPERGQVHWQAGEPPPRPRLEACLSKILGRPQVFAIGNTVWYLRVRGRYGHLGPYLIHLSILLIILGGVLGMIWGFQGQITIPEGDTVTNLHLTGQTQELPLDFAVRLDKFQALFYPDGLPKEYRSELSFIKDGREVFKGSCRVNDPLHFEGLSFYQSSYHLVPRGPIRLNVCHGNLCTQMKVQLRTKVVIPGGEAVIMPLRLERDYHGHGPALLLAYKNGPGHPEIFWILKDFPQAAKQQPGPHRFTLTELDFRYASGLMVKKDPGVWWVYSGFILLLPGFWLAFFTPRQRWAVALQPDAAGGWLIRVHGAGARHREAFQRRLARLLARLEKGAPA